MSCLNSDQLLAAIQKLLSSKVTSRWFQMGVVMGVPIAALESIRTSSDLTGSVERETAMLRCWIEQRPLLPRTWQVLVEAVENRAGGNYRILARDMSLKIPSLIEGWSVHNRYCATMLYYYVIANNYYYFIAGICFIGNVIHCVLNRLIKIFLYCTT